MKSRTSLYEADPYYCIEAEHSGSVGRVLDRGSIVASLRLPTGGVNVLCP